MHGVIRITCNSWLFKSCWVVHHATATIIGRGQDDSFNGYKTSVRQHNISSFFPPKPVLLVYMFNIIAMVTTRVTTEQSFSTSQMDHLILFTTRSNGSISITLWDQRVMHERQTKQRDREKRSGTLPYEN